MAPATCSICHAKTVEYVYHEAGMVIGTLIVCKPCDEAYKAKNKEGKA